MLADHVGRASMRSISLSPWEGGFTSTRFDSLRRAHPPGAWIKAMAPLLPIVKAVGVALIAAVYPPTSADGEFGFQYCAVILSLIWQSFSFAKYAEECADPPIAS